MILEKLQSVSTDRSLVPNKKGLYAPFAFMKHIISIILLLISIPISSSADVKIQNINKRELECLAKNIYFESRGEPLRGMLAVAHVTINRVRNNIYPNTICDVVYQPYQFSWTLDKMTIKNKMLYQSIKNIALGVIIGYTNDPTNGALHFRHVSLRHTVDQKVKRIGNHIFY